MQDPSPVAQDSRQPPSLLTTMPCPPQGVPSDVMPRDWLPTISAASEQRLVHLAKLLLLALSAGVLLLLLNKIDSKLPDLE